MHASYKHVPSTCALLNEMVTNDVQTNATSTSTSTSTSESSSESTSLKNMCTTHETNTINSILKTTAEKVGLIKKRHHCTKPSTSSNESIKLHGLSSTSGSTSTNTSDDIEYDDDSLHLTHNYQFNMFVANNEDNKTPTTTNKIYYDDLKVSSNKRQTTIDVYQTKANDHDPTKSQFESSTHNLKFNPKRVDINTRKMNFIVFVLFVVNLLNYADRYSIAGVVREMQKYYNINDAMAGLIQTVFICSYMLLAPLFGYLGDRYNRKYIIIFGISFWSLTTLCGSFVPGNMFWLFMVLRGLVGIGEASYSCVAPTIIGDLFTDEMRTRMLTIFYLAAPLGSGLGYIVGSNVSYAFNDWRWALRVTPPLGLISIILLIFLVDDPKRGGAEGTNLNLIPNSFMSDVIYLLKNKSFMWVTFGFTFGSFVMGGLSFWVPTFVEYAISSTNRTPEQIPLMFGIVTSVAGLLGVSLAVIIAPRVRLITKRADPLICAFGSLITVPCLFACLIIPRYANMVLYWAIVALGISGMCLCWTLVADIMLYVIEPQRRSMASAMNILICHLLGDAISPYIIGVISDALRSGLDDTNYNRFESLQMALYSGPIFSALSFAAYLFAGLYIVEDKKVMDDFIKKQKEEALMITTVNNSNSDIECIEQNIVQKQQLIETCDEHIVAQDFGQKIADKVGPSLVHRHHSHNESHLNDSYTASHSSTLNNMQDAIKP